VQREDRRGQPRARHLQAAQGDANEKRRAAVQDDRDEVVAERGVAPEAVLDPERGVGDGIVLLRRAQVEPDAPDSRTMISPGTIQGRVMVGIVMFSEPKSSPAFLYSLSQYCLPSEVWGEVKLAVSFLSWRSASSIILPISVCSNWGSIICSGASGLKFTQNFSFGKDNPIRKYFISSSAFSFT